MADNDNLNTEKKHVMVFDHARVDPSHCLTDGLFRPLKKGSYKGLSLDVKYIYKEYTFWWRNYTPLSITDQTVFLAVHRLAAEKGRVDRVGPDNDNPTMLEVRNALSMRYDASGSECFVLRTTFYEIAQTMGITVAGNNYDMIRDSLYRLSGVSFVIYKNDDEKRPFWQTNLFSQLAGVDGKLVIAINPMLSKALAGGQSTFVNMNEQRLLETDVSRRLHVWLSSWARDGMMRKIELDSLIPHVWGNIVEGSALRSRRHSLRKALGELNKLPGWICIEDTTTSMITIKRPKLSETTVLSDTVSDSDLLLKASALD